jgi:hypothetical protein
VPASVNVTVPEPTTPSALVTVAVNVTGSATSDDPDGDTTSVVVARWASETMVRHQPPPIDPVSPRESSTTYRLQAPLGSSPANVASVADEPDGAGGGHPPLPTAVG